YTRFTRTARGARMAAEELNYRRFFDITDLIGVRVEDMTVFNARHGEVLRLVAKGEITGLRVDHVDGLRDPEEFFARMRRGAAGGADSGPGCSEFYVVAEKILGGDEELPREWRVCGTTGYDYLNWLNSLFVDPRGLQRLDAFYREFTGIGSTMGDVQYASKKKIMQQLFPGEVRALGYHLGRLAAVDRMARDLPFDALVEALVEVIAWLPVYRTYIRSREVTDRDRVYLERAIADAEMALPGSNPEVFAFIRRVLLLDIPRYAEYPQDWLDFVMGWQQFTGPCMAKGFEDTTCYVYNRLISQNEVGGVPELADHPLSPEAVHERNRGRLERWPHTMNATSTHDTKRSEDVRARINALTLAADEWAAAVERWAGMNAGHKTELRGAAAPDRNDEYMFYQTLAGAWPFC
ncbi:MAG TPA: malto-oligosyltrehalose synthase, partial [Bryobacteraceae bacterium]|nr:malto-oligosyltrehalose synthase [Bryobacteraceae bacterium]